MASKNQGRGQNKFKEDPMFACGKFNYGSGKGWCSKRDAKRANRGKGQTPGKTKGASCQASSMEKYFAKTSRSYKHKNYGTWLEWCRRQR